MILARFVDLINDDFKDLDIFCDLLATWLEPCKQVEVDDGYVCEAPLRVKCSKSITIPDERQKMMAVV